MFFSPHLSSRFLTTFILGTCFFSPIQAATYSWQGTPTATDWFTAGNWGGGVAPTNYDGDVSHADAIRIDNGGTAIISQPYFLSPFETAFSDTDAIIGDSASGFLQVENGAWLVMMANDPAVGSHDLIVGNQTGSVGGVTVSGTYSHFSAVFDPLYGASMWVGNAGTGTFTVSNAGSANTDALILGRQIGGTGTLNAVTQGSVNATNLVVGDQGIGNLNASGGGVVQSVNFVVGKESGSTGTVNVGGGLGYTADLLVESAVIGKSGTASVTVENYGHLQSLSAVMGEQAGSVANVIVKTFADWVSTNGLTVGDAGQASLRIEGSGYVNVDGAPPSNPLANIIVGNQVGSVGEIIATGMGPGFNLDTKGNIVVGNAGTGTLTVDDRATVSAGGTIHGGGIIELGQASTGVGTLNIGTGAVPGYLTKAKEVHGGSGQATVNFNHNNGHYEFTTKMTGSVSVNQIAGTTVLLGNSTYTGVTTISGGELEVNNAPSLSPTYYAGKLGGTSEVIVESGGTISLVGDQPVVDRINNTANLTLDGGTFKMNGLSEGTTTSAGLGELNLLSTSTIDYDAPATLGILSFSGVGAQTAGAVLQIADWNGVVALGGGASQLLFEGNGADFTSKYDQSEVQFIGYDTGYLIVQGISFYEVVPVAIPEPSSVALMAFGAGFLLWRRRGRQIK